MIEIGISKISKSFGFNKIFDNLSFDVKKRDKVALVGDNGSGKSTILNLIYGIESVDSGNISIRKTSKIGYLRQNYDYIDGEVLVRDILYSNVADITSMRNRLEELEKEMLNTDSKYLDKTIEKYTKLQEQFIEIGGYEIDSRVEKIVSGLNIDKNLLNKKFVTLSGGEKNYS